jgi:hypothetical protein
MPARVDLTPVVLASQRVDVAAPAADFAFVAADVSGFNQVDCTGHELLEVYNSDGSAHTITISGVADPLGRNGSITAYSVPPYATAQKVSVFGPFPSEAFAQLADGKIYINASSALLFLRVLRIP